VTRYTRLTERASGFLAGYLAAWVLTDRLGESGESLVGDEFPVSVEGHCCWLVVVVVLVELAVRAGRRLR
jgi:hypothetical protein